MTDNEIFVDVLTNPDTNWREVAIKIAKENPKAFIAALKPDAEPEYMNKLKILIKENKKVEAIKFYRASQGTIKGADGSDCFKLGLKEAKDYVEALMTTMGCYSISQEHDDRF